MSKPRVLLGDDHTLVLDGFRKLLEDRCEIVGVAEDGRTLLRMAQELKPDIVTLDISMPAAQWDRCRQEAEEASA